jgi:hypothetical protein
MVATVCRRAYRDDEREPSEFEGERGEPTMDNVVGGLLGAEDGSNARELLRLVGGALRSG